MPAIVMIMYFHYITHSHTHTCFFSLLLYMKPLGYLVGINGNTTGVKGLYM